MDNLLTQQSKRIIELEEENDKKNEEIIRLIKELQEKNHEIEKLKENKSFRYFKLTPTSSLDERDESLKKQSENESLLFVSRKSEGVIQNNEKEPGDNTRGESQISLKKNSQVELKKPRGVVQQKEPKFFIPLINKKVQQQQDDILFQSRTQKEEEMKSQEYKSLQKREGDEELLYIPRKSTIISTKEEKSSKGRNNHQQEKNESIKGLVNQDENSFVIKRRQEEKPTSYDHHHNSNKQKLYSSVIDHLSYSYDKEYDEVESKIRMKFDELSMERKLNKNRKERIEMERRLLGEEEGELIFRKTSPLPTDRRKSRKEEIIPITTKARNWICPICEYENSSFHKKCVRFQHHSIIRWTCPVCTFVNENQQFRCEMCAQRKL